MVYQADPEKLRGKIALSRKNIGQLLMDQSFFSGPGNIYRAEILFKAGVHPETKAKALTAGQFDRVWGHSVLLLRRGFETGSILTVDAAEAAAPGARHGLAKARRYIYNASACARCGAASGAPAVLPFSSRQARESDSGHLLLSGAATWASLWATQRALE